MPDSDGPPPAVLIAAVVLSVAAISTVLAIAVTHRVSQQPVALPAIPAPQAADPSCRALLEALPQQLEDYRRTPLAAPAPDGTAAWRAGKDSEPVVLRCGLNRPADFVVGSPIQIVDRVQWFDQVTDPFSGDDTGRSIWYAVDRPVYVALALPPGSGPTPIQRLSELIDSTIAAVPINPAPVS